MRLLIVEDEQKTEAYLHKGLSENGFVVDVTDRGEEGLCLARTGEYDLVILDVMLPGRDGWSAIAEMRRRTGSRDWSWVRTTTWRNRPPFRTCARGCVRAGGAAGPANLSASALRTSRSTCCDIRRRAVGRLST